MKLEANQIYGFTILGVVIIVLFGVLGVMNAIEYSYNDGFCKARGGEYIGTNTCIVEDHVVLIEPGWGK
jgi:hypothetical protein